MDVDAHNEIKDPLLGHQPHVAVELPLFCHLVHLKRLPHELDDREDAHCSTEYDLYDNRHFCPNECIRQDNNNTEQKIQ